MLKSLSLIVCCVSTLSVNAFESIPEDISKWTEQGAVLKSGEGGSWDEKPYQMKPVGVEKVDGVFRLYYLAGSEGCWDRDADTRHLSLGVATSTDGLNFTKSDENPILKPHDFVAVESHEEGIRTAIIRYIDDKNMWLGYFGVESPGGADSCPFLGEESQCRCNIKVDSAIYAATSVDGVNWTTHGQVSGAYNGKGVENYADDFLYADGVFYLWSHRAEGGQTYHASKGPDFMNLTGLGKIPELCFGWATVRAVLHDDRRTVTHVYDPNGGCAPKADDLLFSTSYLSDITQVKNARIIHGYGQKHNFIFRDADAGIWRWYYNVTTGDQAGTIHLRTHPISNGPVDPPKPE